MTAPPILFDRPALTRARNRTLRRGQDLFLHQALADEIQERLIEVNRTFTAPAVVSGFPDFWGKRFPDAKLVADSDRLDLGASQHDLVIHALCLHWANDPVGQLVQSRLALRPDGLLIAALFGGQTLQELRMALADAETRVTGGLSPRVAPMGEIRDLGALLQRAGLNLPVADTVPLTVKYESLDHLIRDLRAMGETNAMAARLRHPTRRAVFDAARKIYADNFTDADGRLTATFDLVVLTGWAPDPSQQKPLRPGSAAQRLADALGSFEIPLDPKSS